MEANSTFFCLEACASSLISDGTSSVGRNGFAEAHDRGVAGGVLGLRASARVGQFAVGALELRFGRRQRGRPPGWPSCAPARRTSATRRRRRRRAITPIRTRRSRRSFRAPVVLAEEPAGVAGLETLVASVARRRAGQRFEEDGDAEGRVRARAARWTAAAGAGGADRARQRGFLDAVDQSQARGAFPPRLGLAGGAAG